MKKLESSKHQDVIVELVSLGLLHPKPRVMGVRALSLLIPSICAAIGLFCFAVVAFSFTEMTNLPYEFRKWLVIVGAFTLATGGEVGTISGVVEISRKRKIKQATWIDIAAVWVSGAASLSEFIIAMSFLSGFDITESVYRILALGILAIFDAYFSFHEFGDYLGSHDNRVDQWKAEYDRAVDRYYDLPTQDNTGPPEEYVTQTEDREMPIGTFPVIGGWQAHCECGWFGDKVYSTEGYANGALTQHERHCPLKVVYDVQDGDF